MSLPYSYVNHILNPVQTPAPAGGPLHHPGKPLLTASGFIPQTLQGMLRSSSHFVNVFTIGHKKPAGQHKNSQAQEPSVNAVNGVWSAGHIAAALGDGLVHLSAVLAAGHTPWGRLRCGRVCSAQVSQVQTRRRGRIFLRTPSMPITTRQKWSRTLMGALHRGQSGISS